ncbi:MAG: hypothetical protein IOD05_00600 [Rhodobacter sp.]|nr:hypothetical protein [Rhodobacter sp.]
MTYADVLRTYPDQTKLMFFIETVIRENLESSDEAWEVMNAAWPKDLTERQAHIIWDLSGGYTCVSDFMDSLESIPA